MLSAGDGTTDVNEEVPGDLKQHEYGNIAGRFLKSSGRTGVFLISAVHIVELSHPAKVFV